MIVFLDLETTGLDPEYAVILELGMVVTDDELSEVGRRAWVLPFAESQHEALDPFILDMHTKSGLLAECAGGVVKPRWQAEHEAVDWLESLAVVRGEVQLGGNTIGFDRKFLGVYMPGLLHHFHYRSIDMSSVNELARRWNPAFYATRPQAAEGAGHRALADLDVSIALAKHYRGIFS